MLWCSLMTHRVFLRLQGLNEAHKSVINTKSVTGAEDHLRCCGGFTGWLRTTRGGGSVCGYFSRGMMQRVL